MEKNQKKSRLAIIILVVISTLLVVMPALAGQGNGSGTGQGNGTGGGQNQPLSLVSSIPADETKDFPINGEIKLSFNKNVVNLAVKDNNKACFELYSSDGTKIPIEIIMPDDQINPELNENVTIKPSQELLGSTAYVVKISPQLQAKNGTTLGQEVTVKFTTAAAGVSTTPANSDQTVNATEKTSDENSETGEQNSNLLYIVIAGVVLIGVLWYLYTRKARQK